MALPPIAQWLKKQRAKKRKTQAELGEAIGMSRSSVSAIERGVQPKPKVEDCALLADYFGMPVREVLALAGYTLAEVAALGAIARREPAPPGRFLTDEELETIMQRAADRAVRALLEELAVGGRAG